MNNECNIVNDLLPLYTEGLASEDSVEFIKKHIKDCEKCKKKLAEMEKENNSSPNIADIPIKKVKDQMRRKKTRLILCSVLCVTAALVSFFAYLTAPKYIPYDAGLIDVSERDGYLAIVFENPVTAYRCTESLNPDTGEKIYYIEAWSSVLDTIINVSPPSFVLDLSKNGECSVYYSQNNGNDDALIFSTSKIAPFEVGYALPRLVLSYYAVIAAALSLILALLYFLFRKNAAKLVIERFLAVPLSYLIGTFIIKGCDLISYDAGRDFIFILLASIPLYCIYLLVSVILHENHSAFFQDSE